MADLERRLAEDRVMRDIARAMLDTSVKRVKREAEPGENGSPVLKDVRRNARYMAEDAADYARANKGPVAAAIGALAAMILLWFFRGTLTDFVLGLFDDGQAELSEEIGEPEPVQDRSDSIQNP